MWSVLSRPAQPHPRPHEPRLHDLRGVSANIPLSARCHSRSGCHVANRQRHRQFRMRRCLKLFIFISSIFTVIYSLCLYSLAKVQNLFLI